MKIKGTETVIGAGHMMAGESCVAGADYQRSDRYATFIQHYIDANP